MIRLANLHRQYQSLEHRLHTAQSNVLASGNCMLGSNTQALEERIAERASAKYCAVVGSGSDALYMGLVACRVKQICIPAHSYIATLNSCIRAFCDISWADVTDTGCIDWNTNTEQDAVWVGLFGNPSTIPQNVRVYEDGAQHFGLPLQGLFAAYSFDPTKTLPNFGNGGAVVTNDEDIIYAVRMLRRHNWVDMHVGGNSVMSERDCAELLVKLEYFNAWTKRRQELAEFYTQELQDYVRIVTDPKGMVSKFVIASDCRAGLRTSISKKGIQSKEVYSNALADLPQAKQNCETFLTIPCDSFTTDKEAKTVANAIREFYETRI